MSHTEPLALLTWNGSWFTACGVHRVDLTQGGSRDVRGKCLHHGPPGAAPDARLPTNDFFTAVLGPVPSPCVVRFEDAPGDPGAAAARALLVGPRDSQVLDEWQPAPEIDGDYFAIDASFSPDGRYLGVARVSVGIGEGERLVRVVSIDVRAAPACR